jgi:hypothetical protein
MYTTHSRKQTHTRRHICALRGALSDFFFLFSYWFMHRCVRVCVCVCVCVCVRVCFVASAKSYFETHKAECVRLHKESLATLQVISVYVCCIILWTKCYEYLDSDSMLWIFVQIRIDYICLCICITSDQITNICPSPSSLCPSLCPSLSLSTFLSLQRHALLLSCASAALRPEATSFSLFYNSKRDIR